MQSREKWHDWAKSLRRFKLDGLASWLLEASSPLHLIGAQVLYISLPLIGGKRFESIAQMMEDENEIQAFAHFLGGEVDQ
jgi:hypothetical protein